MSSALFSDPKALAGIVLAILCIALTFFLRNTNEDQEDDQKIKKAKSLVDMSTSLRQEEDGSGKSEVLDDRVLNPIQFRPFKVLQIKKLSYNTKLIRFEIPHGRSLGLAIGKHISIQARIDGNKVSSIY
jgi:nitrogen fixation-related uncharacterized protein